ncbi:MAG: hypothetical protein V9G14_17630 [Cypionkella sp.]
MQVLDPAEEDFPFDGAHHVSNRMGGSLRHETLKCRRICAAAIWSGWPSARIGLQPLPPSRGWHWQCHHTGTPAQTGAALGLWPRLEG